MAHILNAGCYLVSLTCHNAIVAIGRFCVGSVITEQCSVNYVQLRWLKNICTFLRICDLREKSIVCMIVCARLSVYICPIYVRNVVSQASVNGRIAWRVVSHVCEIEGFRSKYCLPWGCCAMSFAVPQNGLFLRLKCTKFNIDWGSLRSSNPLPSCEAERGRGQKTEKSGGNVICITLLCFRVPHFYVSRCFMLPYFFGDYQSYAILSNSGYIMLCIRHFVVVIQYVYKITVIMLLFSILC